MHAEHFIVTANIWNKQLQRSERRTYGNQGKGTPGYSRSEAEAQAQKITEEFAQSSEQSVDYPLELVNITIELLSGVIIHPTPTH